MCSRRLILLVAGAAGLGACQSVDPVSQSPDPHFGEVTAWNKEVQTIDPDPAYPKDAAKPGAGGARAADAVKRYRQGAVKETQRMSTGGSTGSGSGPN